MSELVCTDDLGIRGLVHATSGLRCVPKSPALRRSLLFRTRLHDGGDCSVADDPAVAERGVLTAASVPTASPTSPRRSTTARPPRSSPPPRSPTAPGPGGPLRRAAPRRAPGPGRRARQGAVSHREIDEEELGVGADPLAGRQLGRTPRASAVHAESARGKFGLSGQFRPARRAVLASRSTCSCGSPRLVESRTERGARKPSATSLCNASPWAGRATSGRPCTYRLVPPGPGWRDGVIATLEWAGGHRPDPPMTHPDPGPCSHPPSAGPPTSAEMTRECRAAEEHLEPGGHRHGSPPATPAPSRPRWHGCTDRPPPPPVRRFRRNHLAIPPWHITVILTHPTRRVSWSNAVTGW